MNNYSKKDYIVAVMVDAPNGVVLVQDPHKPYPRYWKFPGGHKISGEVPVETAKRELNEEVGLELNLGSFNLVFQEERNIRGRVHDFFLFEMKISFEPKLKEMGNEDELVKIVKKEDLLDLGEFFPTHRELSKKFLL